MRLPPRPTIYEINTAVWLERLGRDGGRPLTLAEVPDAAWDAIAALPVDAVWLMGVWARSPAGLEIARADPGLDAGNRAALPDLRDADVIGSPYCVRDYVVDDRFGGRAALATARAALQARGVEMIRGVTYKKIDDAGLHISVGGKNTATSRVLQVDDVVICAGQEPRRDLLAELEAAGVSVHVIGGADVAAELDAKRAIDQGTRLAATL